MLEKAEQRGLCLIICEQRCSERVRAAAAKHDWTLLEGIGAATATHACVAVEPLCVCVELVKASSASPLLLRRLSEVDSIDHLACVLPSLNPELEASLGRLGAQAFTSVDELVRWLQTLEDRGHPKQAVLSNGQIRIHHNVDRQVSGQKG